jgi:hypothetical protein
VAWFLILNCHVIDRLNPGDEIIASGKDKTGVNVGPDPAAFQIRVHPRKWPGHGQLLLPHLTRCGWSMPATSFSTVELTAVFGDVPYPESRYHGMRSHPGGSRLAE